MYIRKLAEDLKPTMSYNGVDSIQDWQTVARNKVQELLGLPLEKCDRDFSITEKEVFEEYTRYDFTFQSEPGYYPPCSLLVPAGMAGVLPVVICLQGHTKGMHISLGEVKFPGDEKAIEEGQDLAIRAVKEGFCAIAMEQRYMGQCGGMQNGNPACSAFSVNGSMGALLLGRTAIGERVWDIQRLIDVIEEELDDYIDAKRIMCIGESGGGTATFYASCLDERIALSIPSGAVCSYDSSIMMINHCPCNFIPHIRKYFDMGDIGCLIAPRPVIIVCGEEDPIFPLDGVEMSYRIMHDFYKILGKEDICCLVKGNGGHRPYPDQVWAVIKIIQNKYWKV